MCLMLRLCRDSSLDSAGGVRAVQTLCDLVTDVGHAREFLLLFNCLLLLLAHFMSTFRF